VDFVFAKFAIIKRTVSELKNSFALLVAVGEFAFVLGAVRPDFFAVAVLLVELPLALVDRAVAVCVRADSVRFVVFPLA